MSTDPTAWSFETKQIHAGQSARHRHRRPRAADLPDDVVRLPTTPSTPPRCSAWPSPATSTPGS